MIRFTVGLAALLALSGCGNIAQDLAALAQDKNAVCVKITTIWASGVLDRNWGCEMPAPERPS